MSDWKRIDNKIITNLGTKSSREFSKGQLQEATQLPHAPARLTSPTHTTKVSKLSGKTTQPTSEKRLQHKQADQCLGHLKLLYAANWSIASKIPQFLFVSFGSKQSNKGCSQSRKYLFRIQTAHLASFCKWGISAASVVHCLFLIHNIWLCSLLPRATSSVFRAKTSWLTVAKELKHYEM